MGPNAAVFHLYLGPRQVLGHDSKLGEIDRLTLHGHFARVHLEDLLDNGVAQQVPTAGITQDGTSSRG